MTVPGVEKPLRRIGACLYPAGDRPRTRRERDGQMTQRSAFWDDLANDLADPEFEREYVTESRQIAEFDEATNADDTRPINPPPEHGG